MFVPTTFGKYFLTEKLATGGMAEIYRGKLLGPGGFEKQLVIKQIHPRLVERREFIEMFVAEAKTTVSLSHGNIVPVYELGVVDGTYFLAMEYVDGPTLGALLGRARVLGRRLGPAVSASIVAEIAKGLDYAHRKGGVIHRDLSPRNVIVSRDGEVKILDFGLAATLDDAAALSRLSSGSGRPVGSFPYMSPEQAARAPLDARSDLFSLGILLWEMLAGRALFARADEDATLEAVRSAPIESVTRHAPEVPAVLDRILIRCLERDPARRYASAGELLAALGRYLYSLDVGVTPETLSALVGEICPDVPRDRDEGASAVASEGSSPESTRPMGKGRAPTQTGEVKSFATHVDLERVLDNRTPLMPIAALRDMVEKPPAGETGVLVQAAPERRGRLWVVVAVVAVGVGVAAWSLRDAPARVPPVVPAVVDEIADAAPPVRVVEVPAVVDAAPPALPPPVVERGRGRLVVVAPDVAWAAVYVDGTRVGETPLPAPGLLLPAGKHQLRVVCEKAVCPPDGRRVQQTVTIGADQTESRTIRF